MRKSVILLVALTCLAVIFIALFLWPKQQSQPNPTAEKRADKPYYPQLRFAISLLNLLQKETPHKNVFYSPHSVYQALLITYFGAAGETEKQLKTVLGLDSSVRKADVERAYNTEKNERAKRFEDQPVEYNSANKLYFEKDIIIRQAK